MNGRLLPVVLIFLMLTAYIPPDNAELVEKSEKIASNSSNLDVLLLGNSYIQQNSLNTRLDGLLDDGGLQATVQALTSGGLKLYDHEDKAKEDGSEWDSALDESNDYVIIQDQSQVPSFPTNAQTWQDSKDAAIYLNQRITSSGGSTILFMTWGYKDGDSNNQWRNPDYPTMQNHLRQGYEMYLENISSDVEPAFIAPVGLAFKHLYDSVAATGADPSQGANSFSTLYSSDGAHPSIDGTYLAACVMYSVMTGESPVGRAHPSQISPARANELQQAAAATVFNETEEYLYPFEIEPPGIEFGPESGSIFSIDPGIRMNLNVNYTNQGDVNDDALVTISGEDGWTIWWGYTNDTESAAQFNADAGVVGWIQFSITAPLTEGGFPLANSIHDFSMEITSVTTGQKDWYNFSMKYGYFHGAEIVDGGGISSISPYDVATVEMVARNIGNTMRDLSVSIRPVNETGIPLADYGQAFQLDEWNIFVLDKRELLDMNPGESGKIRFQVESPQLTEGTMFFEAKIWSNAAPEEALTTTQRVNIVPRSGGTLELSNIDCQFETAPGESCRSELIIQNTGDIAYEFTLSLIESAEWMDATLEFSSVVLQPGQTMNGIDMEVFVSSGTPADLSANLVVELWVDGWNPSSVETTIRSGEVFAWELDVISSELVNGNNLTAVWSLTNNGNSPDGLVVNLDSNIFTEYALIPPSGANYNGLQPRSFDILDIAVGSSITFTAWMIVPDEAPVDTDVVMLIEAFSIRDPRIQFSEEEVAVIGGVGTTEPGEGSGPSVLREWFQAWHTVILSIIVIVIGSIGVALSIRHRLEADRIKFGLPAERELEDENWMEKFSKKDDIIVKIDSPTQPASGFRDEFIEKSGGETEQPRMAPASHRVEIAGATLDKVLTEDALEDIVELADDFNEGDILHPENIILDLDDEFENRISNLRRNKQNEEKK